MAIPAKKTSTKREPNIFIKAINYVKESWGETKRATWPSGSEIQRLTIVVFASVIFVSLYIFIVDTIFALITRMFFGAGR